MSWAFRGSLQDLGSRRARRGDIRCRARGLPSSSARCRRRDLQLGSTDRSRRHSSGHDRAPGRDDTDLGLVRSRRAELHLHAERPEALVGARRRANPVPVYMRVHNLLTTGDGKPALKWGSTNAYTEDASGRPVYDWTIVDRIIDAYIERKMKPFVQLGFMPEAMSSAPPGTPYRHFWKPGDPYNDIYTGWTYPPKDYAKWSELCYQLTRHFVEKYGRQEVESWWFEVWNEPDIGYWRGAQAATKQQDFNTLYDFAAAGVKRALPTAKIGGPEVTGPRARTRSNGCADSSSTRFAAEWRDRSGRSAARSDHVSRQRLADVPARRPRAHGRVEPASSDRPAFTIIKSFPEYARTPIVIGESDPEGCAACGVSHYPQNGYRNGTMFSSYTAEQIDADLSAGRSARSEFDWRGLVGVPVRGPAVLRRFSRPGDERHRQTRAQRVPHAWQDERRSRGGRARPASASSPCATRACAARRTSRRSRPDRRVQRRRWCSTTTMTTCPRPTPRST